MSKKRLIVVPKLYAGEFVYFSAHYHRDEDGVVYRYEVIESIEDRPFFTQEELDKAIETRSAVFWSPSRNELWEKGKTSGETFDLLEVRVNCEQNSMLYLVRPNAGGICHTKNEAGEPRDCYYRSINFESGALVKLNP